MALQQGSDVRKANERLLRQQALRAEENADSISQFWSGTDVRLYFHWVGQGVREVPVSVAITIIEHEEGSPLYGLSDRDYAAVLPGNYLVSGTLQLAFVHTGYLYTLLNDLEEVGGPDTTTLPTKAKDLLLGGSTPIEKAQREQGVGGSIIDGTERLSPEGAYRLIDDHLNSLTRKLWGSSKSGLGDNTKYRGTTLTHKESKATYAFSNRSPLNIICLFGDAENVMSNASAGGSPSTAIVIEDIRFQGRGINILPSGEPITEQYSFIAKSLNTT